MVTKLAPKTISQAKMKRFLELKKSVSEFERLKDEFKALAAMKLPCQPGRYVAAVETKPWTSIPWEDEYQKATSEFAVGSVKKKWNGKSSRTFVTVIDTKPTV